MTTPVRFTPAEIKKHRDQVVKALKSGEFEQTQRVLRRSLPPDEAGKPGFGYCCLGVIETVRGCDWYDRIANGVVVDPAARWSPNASSNYTVLTDDAKTWLGVVTTDPFVAIYTNNAWQARTMTALNDELHYTLEQIGDVIADQPLDWNGSDAGANLDVDRRHESNAEGTV